MSDNKTDVSVTRKKHLVNVENYLKPGKGNSGCWGTLFKDKAFKKFDEAGVAEMLEFVMRMKIMLNMIL